MTDTEINIGIAEACGWKFVEGGEKHGGACWWELNGKYAENGPDNYCSDLNAMHEAEKELSVDERDSYADTLAQSFPAWSFAVLHADARQRAEAFLRTLCKWKD